MRIKISFDSASTDAVRELAVALHNVGLTGTLQVGVNGPEKWSGSTPNLTPNQFAIVTARLVKVDGETVADTLDALRAWTGGVMFTLAIETDNAAFGVHDVEQRAELAAILRKIAERIETTDVVAGPIRDTNGNRVGRYEWADQ